MKTPLDAAQALVNAGFEGWTVVTMGAIAVPETTNRRGKIDELAWHRVITEDPEAPANLSADHGGWQINDFWQRLLMRVLMDKGLLDPILPLSQQLADLQINAHVARAVFLDAGGDEEPWMGYKRWTTWRRDLHMPFVGDAEAAAREIGAI